MPAPVASLVLPPVRLLPLTMLGLSALLLVKAAGLVGAAYGARAADVTPNVGSSVPPAAAWPAPFLVADAAPAPMPASVPPPPTAPPVVSEQLAPVEQTLPPSPDPSARDTTPSPSERALLLDLRKRRLELDARAAAMDQREAVLAAAEKRLSARVNELDALRVRLEALEAARRDRDEASWRGLVRVYETMKPKDAASIFEDLEPSVLLQVVDRMKDTKASAILAAMLPDRARRLTADLAEKRSRANAPPDAGAAIAASAAAAAPKLSPPGASP